MPDTRVYLSTESEKDQFLADVEHAGWILEEQGHNMRAVNYPQRISRSEVLRRLVADFLEKHLQESE
jgi:hypothetical protein